MNIIISFLVAIFLFSNASAENSPSTAEMVKFKASKIIMPNDPNPQARILTPKLPAPRNDPERDLGERIMAGDTFYDYQSNGSVAKMIFLDEEGGVHIAWMDGEGADLANATRNMKYGFAENDEFLEEDGTPINQGDRGGYGHIALTTGDEQTAIAFYHAQVEQGVYSGMVGLDFFLGLGAFQGTPLPQYPDDHVYWPQGVMTQEGLIHVAYNREDAGMISYALGTIDRGEPQFGEFPEQVAETSLNTYRIAASPNSERVAITWVSSRLEVPAPEGWENHIAYQINNDLFMVVSEDGENWNFDDPINVTNTAMPDPDLPGDASHGDIYLPYCTHDVIFDAEDNIHIVFDTRGLWVQAEPVDVPPVDDWTVDYSYLWHWSEDADEITPVADGWYTHAELDDNDEVVRWPTPGAWKSNVCAPSLAFDDNGDLYCVFNYYPLNDNSTSDYCNGEIYATVSEDNGATWYVPTNISETRTHQAELGESACEEYPTLAATVDDFLHISYMLDTEPGSVIQAIRGNEVATLGFWYYHKVPVEDIAREEIWDDGPSFHREVVPVVLGPRRDPATPVPDQSVIVTAEVVGEIIDLAFVEILWTIDGDLDNIRSVEMDIEEGDNYLGVIPGAENGSFIWYKIRAIDQNEGTTDAPSDYWYAYMVRPEGELTIHDVQYRPQMVDWSGDRSPYQDYEVTVTGVVTTSESFADNYGAYAIQEAEEDWSGIYIRGIEDLEDVNSLDVGDQVTVKGIVRERDSDELDRWRYQTYIEVTDAEIDAQVDPMNPIEVPFDELRYSRRSENLEGVLISVMGVELDSLDGIEDGELYYPLISRRGDETGWLALNGIYLDLLEDEFEPRLSEWVVGMTFPIITGVFSESDRYGIAIRDLSDMVLVSVPETSEPLPNALKLEAAYPNPFNSTTKVSFQLPATEMTKLALYDLSGRNVMDLVNGTTSVGNHNITIDAANLSTGIYLLQLEAGGASQSLKLVLIK